MRVRAVTMTGPSSRNVNSWTTSASSFGGRVPSSLTGRDRRPPKSNVTCTLATGSGPWLRTVATMAVGTPAITARSRGRRSTTPTFCTWTEPTSMSRTSPRP